MRGGRQRPWYVGALAVVGVLVLTGVIGLALNDRANRSDLALPSAAPTTEGEQAVDETVPHTVETVPLVTASVPSTASDQGDVGQGGNAAPSTLPPEFRAKVSGTAAATSRFVLRNASGDEATVVIERGTLGRYATGSRNGAVLGEECEYDEDADAAMPLDITIEAAAPPAAYSLSMEMDLQTPTDFDRSSPVLSVDTEALHSPDTRVCIYRRENRPIFAAVEGTGVRSASTRGWVIVSGYLAGNRAENRKKLDQTGWWIRPGKAYPGDKYSVVSSTGAMSVEFPAVRTVLAARPFAPGYELGCAASASC